MAHKKSYGKSKHTERYRVVTDACWPRVKGGTHNARYFEHYNQALIAYTHSLLNQISETVFVERVSFDVRRDSDGTYWPMFESFQHHTLESYGLEHQ